MSRVLFEKLIVAYMANKSMPLWSPNVHSRVHNSPSLDPILSKLNPDPITHVGPGLPSNLFPSGFPNKNFVFISHLSLACYMTRPLVFHDFITVIIFGEEYI
jgi:hypothetical protein